MAPNGSKKIGKLFPHIGMTCDEVFATVDVRYDRTCNHSEHPIPSGPAVSKYFGLGH